MLQSIDCGVYRVSESTVYHYAGYECAAWWQDIRVEAGEYPVKAVLKDGRVESFPVSLPGVIVADNFQSLWGGMSIGESYDEKQNAGKPKSYHVHGRDYEVFQSINDRGNASPWLIDLSMLPNFGICLNPACGSRVTIYADGVVMPKQPALRLVETWRSCAIAETTPRYDVLLNGKLIERLWFNMRGCVGYLPSPSGSYYSIGEKTIAVYRREIAHLNRLYAESNQG